MKSQPGNENEFMMYLLLYAAHADFKLTEEEKSLITSTACNNTYSNVFRQFEQDNDYARLNTILSYRQQYYPKEDDVERVLAAVARLLGCDDKVTLQERYFFKRLKQLLKG
jgi:thiosulfate/3-mercaptopyruvate sulfurtransferase